MPKSEDYIDLLLIIDSNRLREAFLKTISSRSTNVY